MSFYELLGVAEQATTKEIDAAFRARATLYHPDKVAHLGPELQELAADILKQLNRIRSTLSDPLQRRTYDATLNPRRRRATSGLQERPRRAESRNAPDRTGSLLVLSAAVVFLVLTALLLLRLQHQTADKLRLAAIEASGLKAQLEKEERSASELQSLNHANEADLGACRARLTSIQQERYNLARVLDYEMQPGSSKAATTFRQAYFDVAEVREKLDCGGALLTSEQKQGYLADMVGSRVRLKVQVRNLDLEKILIFTEDGRPFRAMAQLAFVAHTNLLDLRIGEEYNVDCAITSLCKSGWLVDRFEFEECILEEPVETTN